MKRITFLSAALLFAAFSLTSCIKSRTCQCRSALNPSANYNYSIGPESSSKAKSDCQNYQFDGQASNADYTCTLQ